MAVNELSAQCSPEAIFAVLADGWLYPVWVVGASRMREVDESWPAAGAKLHHSFGAWPAVIDDVTEMVEWEPPYRALLTAHGWPIGAARVELVVEPTTDGCHLQITEDAVAGPGKLVPKPVRDVMIGIRNAETLNRLRYLAEGGAGTE